MLGAVVLEHALDVAELADQREVENEQRDSRDALAAGAPVPVEPRSIADGLAAPFAGTHGLEICRELVEGIVLVSETELEDAFRFLYARAKLACEPAGAAAVAALLGGKVALEPGETAVAIVSGGNVATQTAVAILGKP